MDKSKSITVVTRHAIVNYGSVLQTIATQEILEKLGMDVTILDYIRNDEHYKNVTNLLLSKSQKWNKNIIYRMIYKIIHGPDHYFSGIAFEKFRNKYLKLSDRINNIDLEKEKIPLTDFYCTGSDQVWGEIGKDELDKVYFLDFVKNKNKCISISASFGRSEYSNERCEKFSKYLNNYKKITVREKTAKALVEKCGKSAEVILDPTLIMSSDDWEKCIPSRKIKEDYVLLYQLNNNSKMDEYAEKFAKKANLKLIRVSPELYNIGKNGKFKWCLSPLDFLSYVKYANYMITDSFHGTAFAITFNTQFIEILPKEKQTRNRNILEQFNLEDRIVDDLESFAEIENKINYVEVNEKLEEARKRSINLIKEMLF